MKIPYELHSTPRKKYINENVFIDTALVVLLIVITEENGVPQVFGDFPTNSTWKKSSLFCRTIVQNKTV